MKQKTVENAKRVLELFPSPHELMNSPLMGKVLYPIHIMAFRDSQEWEGLSMAVDHIMMTMQHRSFTKNGYLFPRNREKGEVILLHAYDGETLVDSLTVYKALLVLMFCSWMGMECFSTDVDYIRKNYAKIEKQAAAYDKLRFDDDEIYSLMD